MESADGVHAHSAHSHDIKPHYVTFDGLLDAHKVEVKMGVLHWESEINLFRGKGLYYAKGEDDKIGQYLLQGVDDTFEGRLIKQLTDQHSDFTNKFLFVGKGIDSDIISEEIKNGV